MRTSRHTFTVYPPDWGVKNRRYKKAKSVRQAKRLAFAYGPGSQVWRMTTRRGRNDDVNQPNTWEAKLASTMTHDYMFEVVGT